MSRTSMVLDYAVKAGDWQRIQQPGVDLPKVTQPEKRYLCPQQVANLAEALGPGRLVVLVLSYCDPRWGELAAIKARRFNHVERRIHIAESVRSMEASSTGACRRSTNAGGFPCPSSSPRNSLSTSRVNVPTTCSSPAPEGQY